MGIISGVRNYKTMKNIKSFSLFESSKTMIEVVNDLTGEVKELNNDSISELVSRDIIKWDDEYQCYTYENKNQYYINSYLIEYYSNNIELYINDIKKIKFSIFINDKNNFEILKNIKLKNYKDFKKVHDVFLNKFPLGSNVNKNLENYLVYLRNEYPDYYKEYCDFYYGRNKDKKRKTSSG